MKNYHFMQAIISKGLYPNKISRITKVFCGTCCTGNPVPIPRFLTQHQLLSRAATCPDKYSVALAASGGHTQCSQCDGGRSHQRDHLPKASLGDSPPCEQVLEIQQATCDSKKEPS